MNDDKTRVAVVTGASSGIGKQIAKALAHQGWRVIGTGRDPSRMAKAEVDIRAASNTGAVAMLHADLSLMAESEKLAEKITALTERVDVLFNNAGGMASELVMTPEGYEANFAGNHLGPFLLTQRLLPLLRAASRDVPKGSVRILNTSSDASEMIPAINLDDIQNLSNWNYGLAYCAGKLANVLFARGLAQRLAGEGIVAHAVHPGAVDSNFFSYAPPETQQHIRNLKKLTEEEGADTLIWLATAEEGAMNSGGYWYQREQRKPNPLAEDDAVVARFWEESERLVERGAKQHVSV